jgi:hypothetical protein
MAYNTPELRIVGRAAAVVKGDDFGHGDSIPMATSDPTSPSEMALGLDD